MGSRGLVLRGSTPCWDSRQVTHRNERRWSTWAAGWSGRSLLIACFLYETGRKASSCDRGEERGCWGLRRERCKSHRGEWVLDQAREP